MSPERLRGLVQELVDENPFAIRAVLRICEIRFSDQVPTLAVTCEDRPALLVNLDFVKKQCRNDDEVKAVLCHEFLHVLLRHTEQVGAITPAKHLAFDAVINAIIHRSFGVTWSALMSHYYARVGDLRKLLRPMNKQEQAAWDAKRYKKGITTHYPAGCTLGPRSMKDAWLPTTSPSCRRAWLPRPRLRARKEHLPLS